jgi:hypothetical protein
VARILTLCISREAGSTTDIRLARYKSGLSGVCFSNYSGYGVCNGGPLTGESKKQSVDQHCGFMFIGKKHFLCEIPRSHIKHEKDKSRASNFVLQQGM